MPRILSSIAHDGIYGPKNCKPGWNETAADDVFWSASRQLIILLFSFLKEDRRSITWMMGPEEGPHDFHWRLDIPQAANGLQRIIS